MVKGVWQNLQTSSLLLQQRFFLPADLYGKTILVSAGPTYYEPLDPVRFIGNHSSGKMGIGIAEELAFTRGKSKPGTRACPYKGTTQKYYSL